MPRARLAQPGKSLLRTGNHGSHLCVRSDGRPMAVQPEPRNKLSPEERQAIIEIVNSEPYGSLPPSQIVPALADEGRYMA